MRFHKLLIVSATMFASTTLAGLSLADPTPTPTSPTPTPAQPTQGATGATGSAPTGSSTTTTVMTPTSPSMPVTTTTTTPPTMPGTTPGMTGTPTSTTTTTSAVGDLPTTGAMPAAATAPPMRDMTVYQKRVPNKAVLITGGALLVGTYATTAALTAANGPVADKDLYIPVAGPWINLADRGSDRSNETRDTVLIAGSGVLQGIGALMAVTSFFIPEKVPAARITAGNVKMNITPTAGPGAGGIGASGTF